MMARVSGSFTVIVDPAPRSLSISIVPRSDSIDRFTTSIPTPRPDTFVTSFAVENPGFRFSVLATDISTQVLRTAALGVYDAERVAPVPDVLKRKYLLRSKDKSRNLVRVAPALRSRVTFRQLNFMDEDFGFTEPVDVIFCRNVIIYFDKPTQERLLNRFCRHLSHGGYIFLGHSETTFGMDLPLTQVAPTVYRKP